MSEIESMDAAADKMLSDSEHFRNKADASRSTGGDFTTTQFLTIAFGLLTCSTILSVGVSICQRLDKISDLHERQP